MKTCYYELLGVAYTATDTELKKAYRRKALEYHPDRNIDNVDETTRIFADIQHAYEILSDAGERRWYDAHKYEILREESDMPAGGSGSGRSSRSSSFFKGFSSNSGSSRMSTNEVMSMFSKSVPSDSFLKTYAAFFARVWDEELNSFAYDKENVKAEGSPALSKTPCDPLEGTEYPKGWYDHWMSFASIKSFAWMDKYRLRDAGDRYVRRRMEKENKRLRDQARREFSDAVRQLAQFVRKRDKRFMAYKVELRKLAEERRHEATKVTKAKREEEKKKLAETYVAPSWAGVKNEDEDGEYSPPPEDDLIDQELYCVVCDIECRTKSKLESHMKTKKHLNKLEKLKQELMEEDEMFFREETAKGTQNGADQDPDEEDEESGEDVSNQADSGENDDSISESVRSSLASASKKKDKKKKKKRKGVNVAPMVGAHPFEPVQEQKPSIFSMVNDPSIINVGGTSSSKNKKKKNKKQNKKKANAAEQHDKPEEKADYHDAKEHLGKNGKDNDDGESMSTAGSSDYDTPPPIPPRYTTLEASDDSDDVDAFGQDTQVEIDAEGDDIISLLAAGNESIANAFANGGKKSPYDILQEDDNGDDSENDSEVESNDVDDLADTVGGITLEENGSSNDFSGRNQGLKSTVNSSLGSMFEASLSKDNTSDDDDDDDWSTGKGKNKKNKNQQLKKKRKQQQHEARQQEQEEKKKQLEEAKLIREQKERARRERIEKKRATKKTNGKSSNDEARIKTDVSDIPDPDAF